MDEGRYVPRTRLALGVYLDALGVNPNRYSLGDWADPNDSIVLAQRPEGWVVFYTERGKETVLAVHAQEADACADLLSRVGYDTYSLCRLIAGPAPAGEADQAFDDWLRDLGTTREELAPDDWLYDDVPWVEGPLWRRYFIRATTARRLLAGR